MDRRVYALADQLLLIERELRALGWWSESRPARKRWPAPSRSAWIRWRSAMAAMDLPAADEADSRKRQRLAAGFGYPGHGRGGLCAAWRGSRRSAGGAWRVRPADRRAVMKLAVRKPGYRPGFSLLQASGEPGQPPVAGRAVFASAAILLDRLFGLGDSLLAFFLAEATEFALASRRPLRAGCSSVARGCCGSLRRTACARPLPSPLAASPCRRSPSARDRPVSAGWSVPGSRGQGKLSGGGRSGYSPWSLAHLAAVVRRVVTPSASTHL